MQTEQGIHSLLTERPQRRKPVLWLCLLFLATGCTTITPPPIANGALAAPHLFSHDNFDHVLRRFVNEEGRVNYAALKDEAQDLDRYYGMLSLYSPDSHPQLFPTEQSKLAYWINAYNAAVIKTVITYYPVTSVEDIRPSWLLALLPEKSGFLLFQRVTFGGVSTSLYALEHQIIRERFVDPRVHFALNCASSGYPHLPRYAFTAEHLHKQLDYETRKFIAEERNLRIDHQEKTVWLSAIFEWYEGDFLTWYEQQFPNQHATLLAYIGLYATTERADELRRAAKYHIRFLPYDWRLNDQRARRERFAEALAPSAAM